MNMDSKADLLKKKQDKTIVAESLDNNASIKEIIDLLHSKHRTQKVYNYFCQVAAQRSASVSYKHFLFPGHPLNSFSEEWDGGLNSGFFETFFHKSLLPRMITKLRHMEKQDPVTAVMLKKNEWNSHWQKFKSVIGRKQKMYEWKDEVLHCPEEFVEMAEHWDNNPDIYFDAAYNWYYAGNGNMHLISLHGDEYLLYSELNCVYLSPFNRNYLTIDYEYEVSYNVGDDIYIFETVVSQNIIAVRTKYKVSILKLVDSNDGYMIQKLKDMESKLPFTGISFDEYHKNILYVTTLDYKLTIVNIDRMTGRSKQLRGGIESLVNNWSTVIGSERMYYTHVTKNSLTLYDKRTNNAFERWKSIKDIVDDVNCNDISVAKYCKGKPMLYIGTDHHIFLLDMRYNKAENKKVKAIQRWTHGSQCIPTYLSICHFEYNKELICLSSQWCEDMCVVSNYADRLTRHKDISSMMIPYRPPSVFATLNEAQEKMLCTDMHNPIQNRLSTAITGLVSVEQGENYSILMLNSLGDISAHTLCPESMSMFVEDEGIEKFDEWSKMYKVKQKDFVVTHIENIQNVWKSLEQVPPTYKFGERKGVKKVNKFNEQDILDAYENEELDPGLLEVWMKTKDDTADPEEQTAAQMFFTAD
ncbi:uncharacterized protein LOC115448303 [Manduca sexta]|uniref:uncharacterized protein LOC115448303 n=1 Tax=Manduca sexta TaxID=7130 RepID=UPI00118353E9|nr:uncharacterized protein LOC115448303 [Manduca sexta]